MNKPLTKNASAYLQSQHTDLHSILAKCKQLDALNSRFNSLLEEKLRKYCIIANITKTKLILLAANSSVATEIRFSAPDLLRKCKSDSLLKAFQEIECIVRPISYKSPAMLAKKSIVVPSLETITDLEEMAESLTDPALKEVMKRIAKSALTKLQPK